MGNPKALNQLLAHHSIIFKNNQEQFYISTNDYQLGEFVGYDLVKTMERKQPVYVKSIPEDPFVYSENYKLYQQFRENKLRINKF